MKRYIRPVVIFGFLILSFVFVLQPGLSYTRLNWSMFFASYIDSTPPAPITDLAASTGSSEGEVDLTWTATGDDGIVGTVDAYLIRYNTVEITETNWLSSTVVSNTLVPKPSGLPENFTVTGLTPDQLYYFAIKSQDEVPNESEVSNSPSATAAPDITSPSDITDLAASTGGSEGEVDLSWTAPGEDGAVGTASAYLIRYNTVEISETNWLTSTVVSHTLAPSPSGISETLTITGLTPGALYYFAIKSQDAFSNTSGVSNSPSAVAATDIISPSDITDLAASTGGREGEVDLSWTAPGDNGSAGTASAYLIRYNTVEISETNWLASTVVSHTLMPSPAGMTETLTITGLTPGALYYFAIKSQDEVSNTSGVSNSPSAVAATDIISPSDVTDLAASTGGSEGEVDLTWTAPGDDGAVGTASTYLIRYNTVEITDTNWLSSTVVSHTLTPSPAGMTETLTITGLTPGALYYFAIKSQDEIPNTSGLSNSPSAVAALESIPPDAIMDLAASTGSNEGEVDLSWTAPGDDGAVGTASAYLIRYNTVEITDTNWLSSTVVSHTLTPSPAGMTETLTITGLTPGQLYYFAIKSQDEIPNTSGLSNSPSAVAALESIPPDAIMDLAANSGSRDGQVDLSWTAPGDDGDAGTASAYLIRYNMVEITDTNWLSSTVVSHTLTPSLAGSAETLTVSDLTPGETYYFAIKSQDEVPNTSGLSNSPSAVAASIPPDAITDLAASTGSIEGQVDLSWTAPGDDGDDGVASVYLVRYNTVEITGANWDASTVVSHTLTPNLAGSAEALTVSGLTPNATYYFAIRSQDEIPNTSGLSNSPSAVAHPDDTSPPPIVLSAVAGDEPGEVILSWTAVQDFEPPRAVKPHKLGVVTTYIARYYTQTIASESDWNAAYDLPGEPLPLSAGTQQSMTVYLLPDHVFHFAIKVQDQASNLSTLSNSPSVRTPPIMAFLPIVLRAGP
jgi:hypothetical protein